MGVVFVRVGAAEEPVFVPVDPELESEPVVELPAP